MDPIPSSLAISTGINMRALSAGALRVQIPGWSNFTQRCKQFATSSTSTQVALLPWRYDTEMGTANSLQASA